MAWLAVMSLDLIPIPAELIAAEKEATKWDSRLN